MEGQLRTTKIEEKKRINTPISYDILFLARKTIPNNNKRGAFYKNLLFFWEILFMSFSATDMVTKLAPALHFFKRREMMYLHAGLI